MPFFKFRKPAESLPQSAEQRGLASRLVDNYKDPCRCSNMRTWRHGTLILRGLATAQKERDNGETQAGKIISRAVKDMFDVLGRTTAETQSEILMNSGYAAKLLLQDESLARAIVEGYIGVRVALERYCELSEDVGTHLTVSYQATLKNILEHVAAIRLLNQLPKDIPPRKDGPK